MLENDGSNYRQWIFDIENFAETIKYGREILRGYKVKLTRTINRDNKEEEEEYTYDPREDARHQWNRIFVLMISQLKTPHILKRSLDHYYM